MFNFLLSKVRSTKFFPVQFNIEMISIEMNSAMMEPFYPFDLTPPSEVVTCSHGGKLSLPSELISGSAPLELGPGRGVRSLKAIYTRAFSNGGF